MIPFQYIEKLLDGSNLTAVEHDKIMNRLIYMERTWNEVNEEFYLLEKDGIIEKLKDNQLDPITHGRGYQQTDILNHLKKLK